MIVVAITRTLEAVNEQYPKSLNQSASPTVTRRRQPRVDEVLDLALFAEEFDGTVPSPRIYINLAGVFFSRLRW